MKLSFIRTSGRLRALVKRVSGKLQLVKDCCCGSLLVAFKNCCANNTPQIVYVDPSITLQCSGVFMFQGECFGSLANQSTYPPRRASEARTLGFSTATVPTDIVCGVRTDGGTPQCGYEESGNLCRNCNQDCCHTFIVAKKCNAPLDPNNRRNNLCCNWGTEWELSARRVLQITRQEFRDGLDCEGFGCRNPQVVNYSITRTETYTRHQSQCDEFGNRNPTGWTQVAFNEIGFNETWDDSQECGVFVHTNQRLFSSGSFDSREPASPTNQPLPLWDFCLFCGCPPLAPFLPAARCGTDRYEIVDQSPRGHVRISQTCNVTRECLNGGRSLSKTTDIWTVPQYDCAPDVLQLHEQYNETITWTVRVIRTNNCNTSYCDGYFAQSGASRTTVPIQSGGSPFTLFDVPL